MSCVDVIKKNGFLKNFNELYPAEQDEVMRDLLVINKCAKNFDTIDEAYEDYVCKLRVAQLGNHYVKLSIIK